MNSVNHADWIRVPPTICLRVEQESKVGTPNNGRGGICRKTGIGKILQQRASDLYSVLPSKSKFIRLIQFSVLIILPHPRPRDRKRRSYNSADI